MTDERRMYEKKRAMRLQMRRKRRFKRAFFLLAEIMVLCLLIGIGYAMVKYDKFQTVVFGEGDIVSNEGVNWSGYKTFAFFGGDSKTGDLEEGAKSDTIMVAAVHSDTKEVRLVSVYRDTAVKHEDGSIQKANHAYYTGGPKDAINMLNRNFDLDIKDYITFDFKALSDVVDLLGGIKLKVTDDEVKEMNKYMSETGRVVKKKAHRLEKAGVYNMDGVQAVTYTRIRKNVGEDYKRTDRQREVISKVIEKAKKTDLVTINKIINQVFPQISTSFSLRDMIGLASVAMDYEIAESTGFPMETMSVRIPEIGSIVAPVGLEENVKELHRFLYPKEKAPKITDTVKEIGTEISELTGVTREDLKRSPDEITRSSYSLKKEKEKEKEASKK